jgi:hypothetical protein
MPRAWKTPRPRRRKLRRLGIPEPVVRKPRYALTRAIRRVSLTEMNEAEERIGSLEIAHETDLKFLETLESFAVQMEGEDDLLLDEEPVHQEVEETGTPAPSVAGAHEVQEAASLESADATDALEEDEIEDIEPELDEIEDLDDVLEDVLEEPDEPEPAAAPPPPALPAAPPLTASPAALDEEPPTIIDADRGQRETARDRADIGTAPSGPDTDAVIAPPPLEDDPVVPMDLDEDLDDMEPDTGELLAAVEQTYSELESLGGATDESDLGDLDGGPDLDSEGLGEIDAGPMQSWDGTSLDEYMHASPGDMGLASWDGDSLEEYIAWNPDAAEDLASWDGTSYEEYLAQHPKGGPGPPQPPGEGERDSSAEVDAWLTEQKLPAATADPAVDPLGLGEDYEGDEPRETAGDEDTAIATPPHDESGEPVDDDELVASQAEEAALDEPAFSLDLEASGELELGLDVPDDDLPSSAVEVKSQNELIVQVGAGLDDALSSEPLSLVLDVEEGTGAEPSMGPVDDLSTGLAIPRSASLAALTGGEEALRGDAGDRNTSTHDATADKPPGDEHGQN